jgi:hypothetical protein
MGRQAVLEVVREHKPARANNVAQREQVWTQQHDGMPVLITLHLSALLRLQDDARDAGYAAWLDDLKRASHVASRSPTP